jgi:enoyl-[acyl-carrier protein] reductase I
VILKGKKILIAGLSDRRSIGYSIAVEAQREGAELILTSFGRMMSITQMTAKKLDPIPEIFEMDVQKPADIAAAAKAIGERWSRLDGLVHSVAYAPPDALGGNFLNTPWESVATAMHVSAFSFKELAAGFLPLMKEHGGSLITLDFDNSTQAWPKYDWMGVSKAALESVPRARPRPLQDSRQRDLCRPAGDACRERHSRLQRFRRGVGKSRAPRLEPPGQVARRPRGVRPALGLPEHDHRRASARRRGLPRDGD